MDPTVKLLSEMTEKADRLLSIVDNICGYSYCWASVHEAAKALGISTEAVKMMIAEGFLTSVHGQRQTYIWWDSIDEAMDKCAVQISLIKKGEYHV